MRSSALPPLPVPLPQGERGRTDQDRIKQTVRCHDPARRVQRTRKDLSLPPCGGGPGRGGHKIRERSEHIHSKLITNNSRLFKPLPYSGRVSAWLNMLGNQVAFCRWLSYKLGFEDAEIIRLPMEAEWRWVAQAGAEHREYPWPGGWNPPGAPILEKAASAER
jgi:hypothetical protein